MNLKGSTSNINFVSCEDFGGVKISELSKKALFGGYNVHSEYLFKSKMKATTAISIFKPHELYENKFCEYQRPAAFGGSNMITICALRDIECIYTIIKPISICKPSALCYLDWGFGLTPSHRDSTVSMLAFAWDRLI